MKDIHFDPCPCTGKNTLLHPPFSGLLPHPSQPGRARSISLQICPSKLISVFEEVLALFLESLVETGEDDVKVASIEWRRVGIRLEEEKDVEEWRRGREEEVGERTLRKRREVVGLQGREVCGRRIGGLLELVGVFGGVLYFPATLWSEKKDGGVICSLEEVSSRDVSWIHFNCLLKWLSFLVLRCYLAGEDDRWLDNESLL